MDKQRYEFVDLNKKEVAQILRDGGCNLIDVPKEYVKSSSTHVRAVEISEGILAPFLCCANCKSLYGWYKLINGKWVNQSGYGVAIKHSMKCGTPVIKKFLEASEKEASKPPPTLSIVWQKTVVEMITSHPTISVSAACELICDAANFAARSTHAANKLYNYNLSRQSVTHSILEQGKLAKLQLHKLFQNMVQDPECTISVITDFRSALPFGGIIACGINRNWEWTTFPLAVVNLDSTESQTAQSFVRDFLAEFTPFLSPLFVCNDNASTMIALDGHFDNDSKIRQYGCAAHRLSKCITDSFKRGNISELDNFMDQLSFIETYYNARPTKASQLPFPITRNSTIHDWQLYYQRFDAHVKNYSHYCKQEDKELENRITNIADIKEMMYIHEKFKAIFDKLESDGATSHLILLLYFLLDYQLYKVVVDVDDQISSSMVKKYCQNFRKILTEQLWPYCSSSVALTAAFLTGVDIKAKIDDMVNAVTEKKKWDMEVYAWANDWLVFCDSILPTVISFIMNLNILPGIEQKPRSDFDMLFDPPSNKALKLDDSQKNKCLIENEVARFQKLRQPTTQPLGYWKNEHRFPLLKASAKIVFAIPVASSVIEHVFSSVGLPLTKLREQMLPALAINSLYTRFSRKMKIWEMIQELPGLIDLSVNISQREIDNVLNEQGTSEGEWERQSDAEFSFLDYSFPSSS